MWSMPVLVGIFSPWRLLSTSLLSSYSTDSFLPLMNIFRSIARQTPSSELYSEHDNSFALFTTGPLWTLFALCGSEWRSCVRPLQNEDVLESARWHMRCIDQPALERWATFLGSDWRSGAESRILVLSQCKRRAEWEGCVAFGSAGKQTVRWPQRLIVSFASIARVNRCTCTSVMRYSCFQSEIKPAHNCPLTV